MTGTLPPPGIGLATGPWRVDMRRAQAITKLDNRAEAEPQLYKIWKGEVIRLLALDRPELEEALMWAEKQDQKIDEMKEIEIDNLLSKYGGAKKVSAEVFDAILTVVSDNLKLILSRSAGNNRGLEMWRIVYRDHESREASVVQAMVHYHIKPPQCKTMDALKKALRDWKIKDDELTAAGQPQSEMVKSSAIYDMVPNEMQEKFLTQNIATDQTCRNVAES